MLTDIVGKTSVAAAGDTTRVYHAGGITNYLSVAFAAANGNSKQIECGFVPRRVEVINETDTIVWTKHHQMAAANAVKETGSAMTIDTGSRILFVDEGSGKGAVLLDPTVVPAGKNVSVQIFGS